jgi:hypothetical protein
LDVGGLGTVPIGPGDRLVAEEPVEAQAMIGPPGLTTSVEAEVLWPPDVLGCSPDEPGSAPGAPGAPLDPVPHVTQLEVGVGTVVSTGDAPPELELAPPGWLGDG